MIPKECLLNNFYFFPLRNKENKEYSCSIGETDPDSGWIRGGSGVDPENTRENPRKLGKSR